MALPSSGALSLSMVNIELKKSASAAISMNDADVRKLFGKASGVISLSDGYGKANALFTITASGIYSSTSGGITTTYRGWSRSGGGTYYFDIIKGDVVTPLEVEAGATVMSAYINTNSSSNVSPLTIELADTRGSSTKPAVDTLGWKSAKTCTINGVVTVQGAWINQTDIKTGVAVGSGFVSVDAQGVPVNQLIGITQEQLNAILAASPTPNTLTFAFS